MLKRGKKGFTLAELLIVVAIIAVLVAIAVPLFISGLKKAQDARDKANIRSVKSAAIVYILNHEKDDTSKTNFDIFKEEEGKTVGLHSYFTVEATIDGSGKITFTKITGVDEEPKTPVVETYDSESGAVTAYISATEIVEAASGAGAGGGGGGS